MKNLNSTPKPIEYQSLIETAEFQIAGRQFKAAKEILHCAISLDPDKPDAYNITGLLHEMQGEWKKARNFYRTALSISPGYRPAILNLKHTNALASRNPVKKRIK